MKLEEASVHFPKEVEVFFKPSFLLPMLSQMHEVFCAHLYLIDLGLEIDVSV